MRRIVLLEDDEDLSYLLTYQLEREGFSVKSFKRLKEFYEGLRDEREALFILDLMLRDGDGLEALRYLRRHPRFARAPVLLLTAKSTERDKLAGFEAGADDYLTKPFSFKELLARVRALLRRCERKTSSYELKGVKIDALERKLWVDGKEVYLTPAEFEILWLLFENFGKTLSRSAIVEQLWLSGRDTSERAVDVHVKHIRDKLGPYRDLIKTVRGVGYRLEA
ncbi:MAG: response regulator transcription factor [Aquificae bacterium]|nr:response regulator transcription factor [Aquificota bacterium]